MRQYGFDIPLEIVTSPYRELVGPVERHLDDLDERWTNDTISVVIPEFLVGLRSLGNALHGQSALALKIALLDRPNTVVISVPFHIGQLHGANANGSQRVAVPLSTRM